MRGAWQLKSNRTLELRSAGVDGVLERAQEAEAAGGQVAPRLGRDKHHRGFRAGRGRHRRRADERVSDATGAGADDSQQGRRGGGLGRDSSTG